MITLVPQSLSGDGATAVVGAYGDPGGTDIGAAYVFTKVGSTWSQSATLQATGGASGAVFGAAVSVSGDGATAVVGAYGVSVSRGAAYAFTKTGSTWSQRVLLGTGSAPNDYFGQAVSISGDGATAVSGAPGVSGGGAAYAFLYG